MVLLTSGDKLATRELLTLTTGQTLRFRAHWQLASYVRLCAAVEYKQRISLNESTHAGDVANEAENCPIFDAMYLLHVVVERSYVNVSVRTGDVIVSSYL